MEEQLKSKNNTNKRIHLHGIEKSNKMPQKIYKNIGQTSVEKKSDQVKIETSFLIQNIIAETLKINEESQLNGLSPITELIKFKDKKSCLNDNINTSQIKKSSSHINENLRIKQNKSLKSIPIQTKRNKADKSEQDKPYICLKGKGTISKGKAKHNNRRKYLNNSFLQMKQTFTGSKTSNVPFENNLNHDDSVEIGFKNDDCVILDKSDLSSGLTINGHKNKTAESFEFKLTPPEMAVSLENIVAEDIVIQDEQLEIVKNLSFSALKQIRNDKNINNEENFKENGNSELRTINSSTNTNKICENLKKNSSQILLENDKEITETSIKNSKKPSKKGRRKPYRKNIRMEAMFLNNKSNIPIKELNHIHTLYKKLENDKYNEKTHSRDSKIKELKLKEFNEENGNSISDNNCQTTFKNKFERYPENSKQAPVQKNEISTENVCSEVPNETNLSSNYTDQYKNNENISYTNPLKIKIALEPSDDNRIDSSGKIKNESHNDNVSENVKSVLSKTKNIVVKTDEKPRCNYCNRICKDFTSFAKHLGNHQKEGIYLCTFCQKSCPNKTELTRHLRVHTGERPYECKVCGKRFSLPGNFKKHRDIHEVERSIPCEVCGKMFRRNEHLKHHMRTHTGERPFKCDVCGSTFTARYSLSIHMNVHMGRKPYECNYCHRAFSDKSSMRKHIRIHTGDKPYSCNQCNQTFRTSGTLASHSSTHNDDRPFSCETCQQDFKTVGGLRQHLKTHQDAKPFTCRFCDKKFLLKYNMVVHERVHTGERPYECKECGKFFKSKSCLGKHTVLHSNDEKKKYSCSHCDQTFWRKDHVKRHIDRHLGIKRYSCTKCKKKFSSNMSLRKHMKIFHTKGARKFPCDKCGRVFKRKIYVEKHICLENDTENEVYDYEKLCTIKEEIDESIIKEESYVDYESYDKQIHGENENLQNYETNQDIKIKVENHE